MAMSAAVSAVLVAVLVTVLNSNDNGQASAAGSDDSMSVSIKSFGSVDDVCSLTEFVEPCKRVLGKVSSAENVTEVIHYSSTAVQEEIHTLLAQSASMKDLTEILKEPKNQDALDSCRMFIENSLDEIEAVIYAASNFRAMPHDMRNWMSAVIADVTACLMELEVAAPELTTRVKVMMGNTSQLMFNGMRIVTGYAATVQAGYGSVIEGIDLGGGAGEKEKRRLLSEEGKGGYPKWMGASERKLLSSDNNAGLTANVVVAQDGSGDVKTIMEAIQKCPQKSDSRFVIYVRAGVYNEHVIIGKDYQNIFMYGDGSRKTVVTGDLNFAIKNIGTAQTASFSK